MGIKENDVIIGLTPLLIKIKEVMCVIVILSCVTVNSRAGELIERNVLIDRDKAVVMFDYVMSGGEVVLIGKLADGKVLPLEGYVFDSGGLDSDLKLRVKITPPSQDSKRRWGDQWRVWYGVVDKDSSIGKIMRLQPERGEERVLATSILLPL